jgi:FkbM family methyltransferase
MMENPVTLESVRWAYRLLLDREPESEQVLRDHLDLASLGALRDRFLSSPEFRSGKLSKKLAAGNRTPSVDRLDTSREFLAQFRPAAYPVPPPGRYTDWLGIVTSVAPFPHAARINGTVRQHLPIPDDGVFASVYEYAAVLHALVTRRDRGTATAVELGCGWAPWTVMFDICARRMGFTDTKLIAVEAAAEKLSSAQQHLADNGVQATLVHAAAWSEDTTLRFGITNPVTDMGGAACDTNAQTGNVDYRGLPARFTEVQGLSLHTICRDLDRIDLMHWDVQGAELKVASAAMELLDERVGCLFIGTHSPVIEASLVDLFYRHGWDVLLHDPVVYAYDRKTPTLEGMTQRDGELFVVNPRLM